MSETVLVVGVGAVAGIGAAVARKFAGAGYHVVVSGRTREKLETVVLQIQETGGSADCIIVDGLLIPGVTGQRRRNTVGRVVEHIGLN